MESLTWKPSFAPTRAQSCHWWRHWRPLPGRAFAGCVDPTRGGVATSLNELARDCRLGVVIAEDEIPMQDAVRGACELLGLDPLHIANEGQFLAIVAPEYCDAAINALNLLPDGLDARTIGTVCQQPAGAVLVTTAYGGSRIVDMLVGDPLPRIC